MITTLFVPSSPALLILVDTMSTAIAFVEAPVFFERIRKSRQRFAHLGSRRRYQLQRTRGRACTIKSTPEGFSGGEEPGKYLQYVVEPISDVMKVLLCSSCVPFGNSRKQVHTSMRIEGAEQRLIIISYHGRRNRAFPKRKTYFQTRLLLENTAVSRQVKNGAAGMYRVPCARSHSPSKCCSFSYCPVAFHHHCDQGASRRVHVGRGCSRSPAPMAALVFLRIGNRLSTERLVTAPALSLCGQRGGMQDGEVGLGRDRHPQIQGLGRTSPAE